MEAEENAEECGTCKFSRFSRKHSDSRETYECRRHAPNPSRESMKTGWPLVDVGDWCGEWQADPSFLEDQDDG